MGNCCSGGESVTITSDKNATVQATSYGARHSQPANSPTDGHSSATLRATSAPSPPLSVPTKAAVPPDYALQPPLRYPGDASGVYYQPTETPTALLSLAFADNDGKDHQHHHQQQQQQQQQQETPSLPPPAAETATRDTVTVTATSTATSVTAATAEPEPVVDSVTSAVSLRQLSNYQPSDVMISYSRSDGEVMRLIKDQLEAEGITVWVDESSIGAGADFLSKIGEAIIDAKFFICILSEKAVRSKYCRDEVALAYVSNTAIFPINLQPRDSLLPLMDTGLKLQLAHYNWTSLTEPDSRVDSVRNLVSTMKAELDELTGQHTQEDDAPSSLPPMGLSPPTASPLTSPEGVKREVSSPDDVEVTVERGVAERGSSPAQSPVSDGEPPDFRTARRLRERNRAVMTLHGDDVSPVMPEQFWGEHFGVVDYISWDRFTGAFQDVFKKPLKDTFSTEDEQHLLDILKRELEVDEGNRIYKYQLMAFCSISGDVSPLWPRVYEQARESFAMREVFNMDSSVRVEAIENLGKFRSAAVIDALRDLLTDPDANVRAVATVSLSRTNADDPVTIRHILRTLSDKDRLVREAGCLALGHLKARQAISKLSHLWRNDVISHVREAAAVALRQIGGQEVEDVMRVTKVLAEEIRSLTEERT